MGSKFPTPAPTDPEHRKPPAPKGPPPMESVTSLQRELAEARNALGTEQEMHNAWRKRGEEAESDVETCRSLAKRLYAWVERSPEMTSEYDEVRQVKDDARKILFAPAPSDVKGEDNFQAALRNVAKNVCQRAATIYLDTNPCACIYEAFAKLESRASLTPIDDPSVRGVLVDDGEPRKIKPDELYSMACDVYRWMSDTQSLFQFQPLKLRPASEFGVAAREDEAKEQAEAEDYLWNIARTRNETLTRLAAERAERIKELEAELAKRTQERDEAVPFMVALKGRHNGYDPGNSKMFPNGPPATPEVALNELIEEQEWLVNSELQQAQSDAERLRERIKELEDLLASETRWAKIYHDNCEGLKADAERLRKAIETHRLEWGAGRVIESNNRLWSALSPSPAAASGEWLTKMADAEDAAGDISIGTSTPATETQGNAQHHSEGAKIPEGGSGSVAAESEGGEPIIKVERVGELSAPELEQWQRECRKEMVEERNRYKAECKALPARLAACEERCKELEAGLRFVESDPKLSIASQFRIEQLLAPKAEGAG